MIERRQRAAPNGASLAGGTSEQPEPGSCPDCARDLGPWYKALMASMMEYVQ